MFEVSPPSHGLVSTETLQQKTCGKSLFFFRLSTCKSEIQLHEPNYLRKQTITDQWIDSWYHGFFFTFEKKTTPVNKNSFFWKKCVVYGVASSFHKANKNDPKLLLGVGIIPWLGCEIFEFKTSALSDQLASHESNHMGVSLNGGFPQQIHGFSY